MKILIVEDDLVSRRLLRKMLEQWGYEVTSAKNGRDAWEIYQNDEFKYVVADWMMPVMDGLELCRKIRATNNKGYVYFILLTSKDKKADLIEGLEAGADDYVIKPFDREELKVRTRAGERILKLEKELMQKNEELGKLNVRLSEIAMIDPLLEIGNRRSFYNSIERAHYNAFRYSQKYGMIMCDIDNFKSYNDTYGHMKGDQVLKKVADAVSHGLRLSDNVFRFGGEEFVIVLPDQTLEGTVKVAERIRKAVEDLKIEHKCADSGILTISCGVASFTDTDRQEKWEDVLNRADQALYTAKESGRNQVGKPSNSS
jgi:diguanylate cyclase (GGDEF)-like protein